MLNSFKVIGFIAILLSIFSCNNRPDDVMSQRHMRRFLTDMHLMEAAMDARPLPEEHERGLYYQALFEKHGVSKAIFDSSVVFYTKNPKRFERIYTRVVQDLKILRDDVHGGKYFPILPDSIRLKPDLVDMWVKPRSIEWNHDSIHTDSVGSALCFSIKHADLLTQDIYHLCFLLRISASRLIEDDSIESTHAKGYAALKIHYNNGVVDSLMHETYNDSVLRRYRFRMKASRNVIIDSLSGVFTSRVACVDSLSVTVDSISLKREFIPYLQDSLRLQLDTMTQVSVSTPDSLRKNEKKRSDKPTQTNYLKTR